MDDHQPTIVEIPGYGEVEFPAGMSMADITTAVQRLGGRHQESRAPKARVAPETKEAFLTGGRVLAGTGLAAAALPAGVAMGALRTLTRPAVLGGIGAVAGGVKGYERGGLFGGLEGAVRGAFEGGLGGQAVHGRGSIWSRLAASVPAATDAAAAGRLTATAPGTVRIAGQAAPVGSLGPAARRLILSPADAAAETRLERLASGAGTLTGAAGARAKAAREALAALLKRGE